MKEGLSGGPRAYGVVSQNLRPLGGASSILRHHVTCSFEVIPDGGAAKSRQTFAQILHIQPRKKQGREDVTLTPGHVAVRKLPSLAVERNAFTKELPVNLLGELCDRTR